MTPKEFLQGYKSMTERIRQTRERLEIIQSEITGAAISYDGMPHGTPEPDQIGEAVARLSEIKAKLESQTAAALMIREDIADAIADVRNPDQSRLLYLRYVRLMSWDRIAREMGYSVEHVKGYLHGHALQQIAVPEEDRWERVESCGGR